MTQRRKCDVCRARKVKCDEKRPVCGQCRVRRRECTYAHGNSNFVLELPTQVTSDVQSLAGKIGAACSKLHDSQVTLLLAEDLASCRPPLGLNLRRSRPAPSGDGTFRKFGPEQVRKPGRRSHGASQAGHSRACASPEVSLDRRSMLCRPTPNPGNNTTRLQEALVTRLNCPDDCRYDLSFRYGSFLFAIPRRLGRNEALDMATAALLARHEEAALQQDQTALQAPVVALYHRALSALRTTLDEPDKATTIETLCAVLMLTYCQARFDDQFTFFWSPHVSGIAQLLRMLNFPSGSNVFEMCLFGPLNATLLLQSFANPVVRLSRSEYRALAKAISSAAGAQLDVRHWQMMVRVSELMARGRDAIRFGSSLNVLGREAKELEESFQVVLASMQARLRNLESLRPDGSFDTRLHAIHQRTYGTALATSAMLHTVQRTLCPSELDRYSAAATLCHEVLRITDEASIYRPLGAVWTVHTLMCTWCAAEEVGLREKVEAALIDYQNHAMAPARGLRIDQLQLLERRFCLLD